MAQDRAIDKAFRVGGYGRQTRYGVRHGALAGSIIGTLISDTDNQLNGNGIQKTIRKPKQTTTGKSYKTRSRRSTRFTPKCEYPKTTYRS